MKAKLNWDLADEIRDLLDDGVPATKIAEMYGVTNTNISRIKHKEGWFDLERDLARRQRRANKTN